MRLTRFANFAWIVLIYNLAVVAWGVFVRASKSGDGCGNHWPLCDGDHTPLMGTFGRYVEMSHRISTTLCGVLSIILVVWAVREFAANHPARKASYVVLGMTIFEGLIGAVLVKYGLVVNNDSAARAAVMALHVNSTYILVGALLCTALWSMGAPRIQWKDQGALTSMLGMGAFGVMFLGVSGAISALGHQLKPVDNVLAAAMNPATHWMVRLQPLHPMIGISVGLYLLMVGSLIVHLRPDPNVQRAVRCMVGIFFVQGLIGGASILLKAPIAMQMLHLVMADVSFLGLVGVSVFALGEGVRRAEWETPAPKLTEGFEALTGRALVNAYIALTKPRVISLLLFTTLTSMVAARGHWPNGWLVLVVMVAGYMSAGAANAINMVIDRDIDGTMARTAKRPTVTNQIPSRNVLVFAFTMALTAFLMLWTVANLLSALMALSGLVFYVVIYSLLLKRRTWHNIVIGGAAGAFPPLVGWAAVTNDLPPLALYMFAIVFVWTPVHFWALALLLQDDYASVGVPMLPVVKGQRYTVNSIAVYTVITVIVTMLPLLMPQVGMIYGVAAAILNIILLVRCARLWKQIDRPRASSLFHYSMLYLALLFLVFAIDRTVVMS
ncbi:MAG: heme o synthase [Fimbriimonas sp.]